MRLIFLNELSTFSFKIFFALWFISVAFRIGISLDTLPFDFVLNSLFYSSCNLFHLFMIESPSMLCYWRMCPLQRLFVEKIVFRKNSYIIFWKSYSFGLIASISWWAAENRLNKWRYRLLLLTLAWNSFCLSNFIKLHSRTTFPWL